MPTPTQKAAARHVPPSRRGKRPVTAWMPEGAVWQLQRLAREKSTTIQRLISEAVSDLFRKYGLAPTPE